MIKCECGRWFSNKRALAAHQSKCEVFRKRKDDEKAQLSELKQQISEYDQKIKEQAEENDTLVQENKKLKYELEEHRIAVCGLKRKCELLEYDNSKLKEEIDCS
ncbi:hypothetical protein F1737_04635 [Methanoplanus sp. FWC-SCC4]|uniref:Uncharacterized protein n=1 Tax=Methanochimaera problematica TaxID=2609417 RepID=A0AA97FEN7_9EURY|nr:hypothetical protein [Methanoplanus sp. FWC-SCC4]WOF16041.1 hypothetical protein F1737_04635 [Methanoplanus sp. FWC-SCC4]